jgi:predicted ATP-dependent serine protease
MDNDFVPMAVTKKKTKILTPSQIIKKKRDYVELSGAIGASIGKIELGSKIFITGRSYSGKSSFITKVCALMSEHTRVDYNNHEEKGGDAATVIEKMRFAGIDNSFDKKIRFYKAPIESDIEETFGDILSRKNSAGFAVLDSLQHAGVNKKQYINFTSKFCNTRRKKIVAFISHWQKNDFVLHVKHDCDIKLEVMHYVVYVESRMSGATNKPIVLWEDGAKKAWGKKYKQVIEGKYWPGKK